MIGMGLGFWETSVGQTDKGYCHYGSYIPKQGADSKENTVNKQVILYARK